MSSTLRKPGRLLASLLLVASLLAATPASAAKGDEYDPVKAGHPLRITAYLLHPVGVILDTLIFHPLWRLFGHEPLRTLVGRDEPVE